MRNKAEIDDTKDFNRQSFFINWITFSYFQSRHADPLTRIDLRYRNLVGKYVEQRRKTQIIYVFRNSPIKVLDLMNSNDEDIVKLIDSLAGIRVFAEDHAVVEYAAGVDGDLQ
jgi:hypothetical protein